MKFALKYQNSTLMLKFVLLLFLGARLYGQTGNLRSYYENINLAELAIIENNLDQAAKYYKAAFNSGYSFPKDKYNDFRVSYLLKDTLQSVDCFNYLANLGQDKTKFIQYFFQVDSLVYDPYMEFVTHDYDSTIKKANLRSKHALASKLNKIYQMDQLCRQENISTNDLWRCDSNVLEKMYDYIDSFGFPSADKVGLLEQIVIQAPNSGAFDWLVWHCRGRNELRLYDIGRYYVHKGLYDARKFSRGFAYLSNDYYVLLPRQALTYAELEEVNKRRAGIFLEPLQDYARKIKFQKNNGAYRKDFYLVDFFVSAYNPSSELNIVK